MKSMKLAAACAALTLTMGFTSCNDDNDTGSSLGYFRVVNNYGTVYFEDAYGVRYNPTQTIISESTSALAFLYFSYSYSSVTDNATSIDITLLQDPVYLKQSNCLTSSLPEENETVSLYGLSGGIWGENEFLVLTPTYFINSSTTTETLESEVENHNMTLYYVSGESNDSTLTVHLRYQISGVSASEDDTWADDYKFLTYTDAIYADMSEILAAYNSEYSGEPEKIVIEYEQNSTSTMDPDEKTSTTVEYSWVDSN